MTSLTADYIDNTVVRLHDLFHANVQKTGQMIILGKTFTNCRLEGPAVIVPMPNCFFDRCDFGDASGDMRNMLYRPLSAQQVTGAIVFNRTRFVKCTFYAVGYAGNDEFVRGMLDVPMTDAPK